MKNSGSGVAGLVASGIFIYLLITIMSYTIVLVVGILFMIGAVIKMHIDEKKRKQEEEEMRQAREKAEMQAIEVSNEGEKIEEENIQEINKTQTLEK